RCRDLRRVIAKPTRLLGAHAGIVLRIEVQHDRLLPAEVAEREPFPVPRHAAELRRSFPDRDHPVCLSRPAAKGILHYGGPPRPLRSWRFLLARPERQSKRARSVSNSVRTSSTSSGDSSPSSTAPPVTMDPYPIDVAMRSARATIAASGDAFAP